jgi:hypothetical protein
MTATIVQYLTSTISVLLAVIFGGLVIHLPRHDRDYYSYGVLWRTRLFYRIMRSGATVLLSFVGLFHLLPSFVAETFVEHVPYKSLVRALFGPWVLDVAWASLAISTVLVILVSIVFFIGCLLILLTDRPIRINVDRESATFAGIVAGAMAKRRATQSGVVVLICLAVTFFIGHYIPWPLLALLSLIGIDLCLILYRRRRSLYGRDGLELAEAARYVIYEQRAGGGPGHFKSVFSKKPVVAPREARLIPDATAGARS